MEEIEKALFIANLAMFVGKEYNWTYEDRLALKRAAEIVGRWKRNGSRDRGRETSPSEVSEEARAG